jgi:hypothetical protein
MMRPRVWGDNRRVILAADVAVALHFKRPGIWVIPDRPELRQRVRHQASARAHALPPIFGSALPLSCEKAENPARQTRSRHLDPPHFQRLGWGTSACLGTAREPITAPSASARKAARVRGPGGSGGSTANGLAAAMSVVSRSASSVTL